MRNWLIILIIGLSTTLKALAADSQVAILYYLDDQDQKKELVFVNNQLTVTEDIADQATLRIGSYFANELSLPVTFNWKNKTATDSKAPVFLTGDISNKPQYETFSPGTHLISYSENNAAPIELTLRVTANNPPSNPKTAILYYIDDQGQKKELVFANNQLTVTEDIADQATLRIGSYRAKELSLPVTFNWKNNTAIDSKAPVFLTGDISNSPQYESFSPGTHLISYSENNTAPVELTLRVTANNPPPNPIPTPQPTPQPTPPNSSADILVNPNIKHQIFDYWEAAKHALESSSDYNLFKDEVFERNIEEIGIRRIRLEVRAGAENTIDYYQLYKNGQISHEQWRCFRYATSNDNSDPNDLDLSGFNFTELDEKIEQVVLPLKQKMQSKGLNLKINLTYVAFTQQMQESQCPGNLVYEHADTDEYAEFILAVMKHIRQKYNITPDFLEAILEPDLAMDWKDGYQVGNGIRKAGDLLKANGFQPKFIGPSTTSLSKASTFIDQINTIPGAMNYIEEISYHKYSAHPVGRTQALKDIGDRARLYNKKTSMLEWWSQGNDYIALHDDLKLGMVSSYQFGYLAHRPGVILANLNVDDTIPGAPVVSIPKQTRLITQYTNYIKKGAQRIESTSQNSNLDALTFVNPNGKYTVVVRANSAGSISIENLPSGTYEITYSTKNAYKARNPDQSIQPGELINTSIPAAGAITINQL